MPLAFGLDNVPKETPGLEAVLTQFFKSKKQVEFSVSAKSILHWSFV